MAEKELGIVVANVLKCFSIQATTKPACALPPQSDSFQRPPVHVPLKFVARVKIDELTGLDEDD